MQRTTLMGTLPPKEPHNLLGYELHRHVQLTTQHHRAAHNPNLRESFLKSVSVNEIYYTI